MLRSREPSKRQPKKRKAKGKRAFLLKTQETGTEMLRTGTDEELNPSMPGHREDSLRPSSALWGLYPHCVAWQCPWPLSMQVTGQSPNGGGGEASAATGSQPTLPLPTWKDVLFYSQPHNDATLPPLLFLILLLLLQKLVFFEHLPCARHCPK